MVEAIRDFLVVSSVLHEVTSQILEHKKLSAHVFVKVKQ